MLGAAFLASHEPPSPVTVRPTAIPGLLIVSLDVRTDSRGWFKENWQRAKMTSVGLPDFVPVQNNVSFNAVRGTTRGVHAEPWDKYVSVSSGRIFGAWVDLREGAGFGTTVTAELDPSTAVFVPRGVGNAYQTLEDATAYSYLVTDHWSPEAEYTFLNLGDETAGIPWPIPLDESERSSKDLGHPRLRDVVPVRRRRILVLGGSGQLGRELVARRDELRDLGPVDVRSRAQFDLADPDAVDGVNWGDYDTVINAAAFTGVDAAETPDGRKTAWAVNAVGVAALASACARHGVRLVNVSSDYVFDGGTPEHCEDEPFSPLGVYGQSKAAGDVSVMTVPRHWILRTSWVVGDGPNFVKTMMDLARRQVDPVVVSDQFGRLTFTAQIVDALVHLMRVKAPDGVYNVSNAGDPVSWSEIARRTFELVEADPARVTETTSAEYARGKALAPRPARSDFDLTRIRSTGLELRDQFDALAEYVRGSERE